MSTALSQPTLDLQASPSVCDGRQFTQVDQAVLWTLLQQAPYCTWPRVSLRHLNRWRARWQLSPDKGRPCRVSARVTVSDGRAVVCVTPRLSFVGVHLFARWLDQQEALEPVVAGLQETISGYQRTHPDDDFALLHHRNDTLKSRFEALVLAPLLGRDRLSGFDTQEQPLETLIGTSYQAT
ncbi:hypothetical protein C2W62_30460, partial [Candidatus Entotheonella serta]